MRGRKLIMSVDRLDYSKGLVERFQAFERLLLNAPGWHGRVSLVQIAPPTRSDVQTYQRIRQNLEGEAGRINGRFAQLDWTPIQYLNRKYDRNLLMALFRLSQVGYVDAAARRHEPRREGIRGLAGPRRSGRARALAVREAPRTSCPGALVVNPFDLSQMSEALERALSMPLAERQARHADMMAPLREMQPVRVARFVPARSAQCRDGGIRHEKDREAGRRGEAAGQGFELRLRLVRFASFRPRARFRRGALFFGAARGTRLCET